MRFTHRIAAAVVAGLLSLALSTAAVAQGQGRRGGRGATLPAVWATKLMLTEEQKGKIEAANTAYRTETRGLASVTDQQERRAVGQKARETYTTALNGILTADQQKQVAALREAVREYEGMGEAATTMVALDLTEEQKTKVKAIAAKYQPELEKLRAQRQTATDRRALRQQMRAEYDKMMDEVKAILTPAQIQLL
ncbi:MAG TPA: Spy/CpxP family protein refolding chaperone, partial [Armatimonadota bacterium]|nr:Spy/CpxP family protein refolding chaperone [Armatimonadota bacterium]